MSGSYPARPGDPHDIPQAAANPIPFDRVADLLRHGKANPRWSVIDPLARLQHERGSGGLDAGRRSQKIRPLPQSFHGNNACGSGARRQAESRLRPRERRAESTLRPPLVAMRVRKP
jgi:hypothetical protein